MVQHPQVAFAAGEADAVEILAEGDGVFAGGAEEVADFGDGHPLGALEFFADEFFHLALDVGVQVNIRTDLHQQALGDADVVEVAKVGRVAAGLIGETFRRGWVELRFEMRLNDAVFQLAEIGAKFRLEVGRRNPAGVADHFLAFNKAIDRRADQGVVLDVGQLRLHFLPIVRCHQWILLVHLGELFEQLAIEFIDQIAMQQSSLAVADRDFDEFEVLLELVDEHRRFGGAETAIADQVGDGDAGIAAKPGDGEGEFLAAAGPEFFDAFELFDMAAADFSSYGLQHLPAAQRVLGG